jgi:hypothetical protein
MFGKTRSSAGRHQIQPAKIAWRIFFSATIVATLPAAFAQQNNSPFLSIKNKSDAPTTNQTRNMTDHPPKLLPSSIPLWNKDLGSDTVVMDVTASTNFPAYRIMIKRNGDASYDSGPDRSGDGGGEQHAKAPDALTTKIFQELDKSWPFTANPQHVMKSASFGTYSYISYKGSHSADLDALVHQDGGARALRADFQEVGKLFQQ